MLSCIKFILLAQQASDSGKGSDSAPHNGRNATDAGYGLKDQYIRQAVAAAKTTPEVEAYWDGQVVYFDIRGFGQVSFHVFQQYDLPEGFWCGKFCSRAVCTRLAKKFNLNWYKRGVGM